MSGGALSRQRSSLIKHIKQEELSSTFDYVMVFPMDKHDNSKQSKYAKYVVNAMNGAGLETFSYTSIQDDEMIVLIRSPHEKLKSFADELDYKLELDPVVLKKVLAEGVKDPESKDDGYRIKPININEDPLYSTLSPYDYIYGKYDSETNQDLYRKHSDGVSETPFSKAVKLKLIYYMLRAPRSQGGCGLEINKLIFRKKMLAIFPLHERDVTTQLLDIIWDWNCAPWSVPFEDYRMYYGEKIGLYSVFIGHYSKWLIIPGVIGFIFQLVVWGTLNFSSPVLPFYSIIVCVWSICMLEFWKRQEQVTALEWGMTEFERFEPDRPEFRGDPITSYITGKPTLYFPPSEYMSNICSSTGVVYVFLMLVIGVVASIYVMRFSIQKDVGTYASLIASVLNTVQITVFNIIYQTVAVNLTDAENQRTDTQYEDSMIIKLFVFQFINSYASFFFLAFIAAYIGNSSDDDNNEGECGYHDCMQPLSINLAIIFGTRLTLRNFLDIFLPYLKFKHKFQQETQGVENAEGRLTPAERQYMLINYDGLVEGINNYADTAIQYGYSLLFVTALPCAAFFSLISNYFKVKLNAWKLSAFYQRPVPSGAQDIGTWMTIFQFISVAAVITNGGLICFTMDVLPYSLLTRVWLFIGFQWTLLLLQFGASEIVPDEPGDVSTQKERMEFITSKVIDRVEDEPFEVVTSDAVDDGEEEEEEVATSNGGGMPCCGGASKRKRLVKKLKFTGVPEVTLNQYPQRPQAGNVAETANPMGTNNSLA